MATLEETIIHSNEMPSSASELDNRYSPIEESPTRVMSNGERPSREELIDMVRKAGIPVTTTSEHKSSISEPSSPRKVLGWLNNVPLNTIKDNSSCSSSTLTSEDGHVDSLDCLPSSKPGRSDSDPLKSSIPEVVVNDSTDNNLQEFRGRSGSQFYHESFTPKTNTYKPVMYIPASQSAQQLTVSLDRKKKGLFSRLRNSFRGNKHRPVGRTVSDKSVMLSGKRWIDYEEELDPVSRPSYFRHIGHVITTGPGTIKTIELNRPAHGKFGIYIAQGFDPESTSQKKSIFVSRFYQENMNKFYASLLNPGDEIVAINGHIVRDLSITEVSSLLEGILTVRLTLLPVTESKNDPS